MKVLECELIKTRSFLVLEFFDNKYLINLGKVKGT